MGEAYDLKDLNTPVLQGTALSLVCKATERLPTVAKLLVANSGGFILRKGKYEKLLQDAQPLQDPTGHPHYQAQAQKPLDPSTANAQLQSLLDTEKPLPLGAPFYSCRDYYEAYSSKQLDPVAVARAIIKAILLDEAQSLTVGSERISAISSWKQEDILAQAEESKKRLESNAARSVLEGVPFVVKDMIDVEGVATTCGTSYMGKKNGEAEEDAFCVKRLRDAGMMLIGKTVMHEIGIAPIGVSVPPKQSARNPYNTRFHTGGSSSGSAAAVVMGLCPIALGTDTGGSIRVPAAHSGCFGLKATYGRIKMDGVFPFNVATDHVGPLASTSEDIALALQVLAGAQLPGLKGVSAAESFVKGKKIGIFKEWFDSAKNQREKEYTEICRRTIEQLEELGAEVVDISIPYLEATKVAHLISVSFQTGQAISEYWADYKQEMLGSTRFTMIAAKAWNQDDFAAAQRMRQYAIDRVVQVLEQCDVIATPTCQVPAPKIRSLNLNDRSDITLVGKIMKYVFLGNFVGLPGIACPVGYTQKDNLPVSIQFYGDFFQEEMLLQFAKVVECSIMKDSRKKPANFVDILKAAKDS